MRIKNGIVRIFFGRLRFIYFLYRDPFFLAQVVTGCAKVLALLFCVCMCINSEQVELESSSFSGFNQARREGGTTGTFSRGPQPWGGPWGPMGVHREKNKFFSIVTKGKYKESRGLSGSQFVS